MSVDISKQFKIVVHKIDDQYSATLTPMYRYPIGGLPFSTNDDQWHSNEQQAIDNVVNIHNAAVLCMNQYCSTLTRPFATTEQCFIERWYK